MGLPFLSLCSLTDSNAPHTQQQGHRLQGHTYWSSQLWRGYGSAGDVFLGISTSGNSKNILYAAITAHAKGLKVIGLTGESDSQLSRISDICIRVPQTETYMVQELHLPIYHCLCLMLEEKFFGESE